MPSSNIHMQEANYHNALNWANETYAKNIETIENEYRHGCHAFGEEPIYDFSNKAAIGIVPLYVQYRGNLAAERNAHETLVKGIEEHYHHLRKNNRLNKKKPLGRRLSSGVKRWVRSSGLYRMSSDIKIWLELEVSSVISHIF